MENEDDLYCLSGKSLLEKIELEWEKMSLFNGSLYDLKEMQVSTLVQNLFPSCTNINSLRMIGGASTLNNFQIQTEYKPSCI